MIIFLACTKTKKGYPCAAKEMYSASMLFKLGYSYALSIKPNAIYILSAKYGLLTPDAHIEPYEKTLTAAKDAEIRAWSKMVAAQIRDAGIACDEKAIFLCGKNYRKYIQNLFPNHEAPLAHKGIGKQMQYFKEHL